MKTTEKGKLAIVTGKNNKQMAVFQPSGETIWMDRNELCELFGVYMQAIDTAIDSIFKTKMFRVEDACKYNMYAKGSRISYDITEVNLEVIVAMAFHIDSSNAAILREWFMNPLLELKKIDLSLLSMREIYSLN